MLHAWQRNRIQPMKRRLLIPLSLAAALVAGSARAGIADGTLPDGGYRCEVYLLGAFLYLGDITIKGRVYSGPTYGPAMQGYNYEMDKNGEITWLGPLGGFSTGGNKVSLTQATEDGPKNIFFDIIMRQPDGAASAATCTLR
jgi:hypothetical protein